MSSWLVGCDWHMHCLTHMDITAFTCALLGSFRTLAGAAGSIMYILKYLVADAYFAGSVSVDCRWRDPL